MAASRRRDLLQSLVIVAILLTPAWLTPPWFAWPWLVAVLVLAGPLIVLTWVHAPWVPTPAAELPRILAALSLSPDQRFCDLGAGDGRVVARVGAATGAECVGIEASVLLYGLARVRLALTGTARTRMRLGNLYRADLSDFDVVYVWGTAYSVGTPAFARWLQRELRPGTRVVSYHTPLHDLEPVAVDRQGQRPLFTYELP